MEITARILLILVTLMTINSCVKYPLEKLTKYKMSDITNQPSWFVIMFAFCGLFMLPFYRQIRQYRKEYYIKNKVRMYEFWVLGHGLRPPDENVSVQDVWPIPSVPEDDDFREYMNNKRYLKLLTIQRKTRRNVYFRKLGF